MKATIWANETSNGRMFNTQLVRVYREENGDWKETTSLGQADLLVGARLLEMAFTVIMQAEETERQRQQQAA